MLALPGALAPLEQCVQLLLGDSPTSSGLSAFGTLYPSCTERALLDAVGWLQDGEPEEAKAILESCAAGGLPAGVLESLQLWSAEILKVGARVSRSR